MARLVSIVIPAYNAEKWIADAIGSAIAQKWHRKELIVVDDGSTDSTLAVAKGYASAFVNVVTQENKGASAARNKGLSLAQGDYIQWLDADDLLAPDKISQQLWDAEDGATTRVLLSSAFGEFHVHPGNARLTPHVLWQDLEPIDFLLNKFTRNVWLNPAAWLVSRRLTELAGPWDERLSLDDDGEYFSRVVASAVWVRFVPEAKSYYRQGNVGSLSRATSQSACDSLLLSTSLCIQHLTAMEDSERTRKAALNLLQTRIDQSDCFHPDRGDLLPRAQELARNLGGVVVPPRLRWKYRLIEMLFGWEAARKVRTFVANTKLRARIRFEETWQSRRSLLGGGNANTAPQTASRSSKSFRR